MYGTITPPGWYPDPAAPASFRWWDGAQWTPYVHVPGPMPDVTGKNDPAYWLLPVGRPWQALVAGYLGVVCLITWLMGPVGVVFGAITVALGIWGLDAGRSRKLGGQGRAWFGIVTGAVSAVVSILLMLANG